MELPAVNLKVIILFHWFLTVWATLLPTCPSYAWSNFTLLGVGVWAQIRPDSLDAIAMFLAGLLLTLITDSVAIGLQYGVLVYSATGRFSVGMAILSLILKPFSCFLVFHMYRERGGTWQPHITGLSLPKIRADYEPISDPDSPHAPPTAPTHLAPHQHHHHHHPDPFQPLSSSRYPPDTTFAPSPQY